MHARECSSRYSPAMTVRFHFRRLLARRHPHRHRSLDRTARIWDARVSATLAAQILWAKVAQTDPLADLDRTELGLPPDARVKQWRTQGSACDQAAAAFYDPDRVTRGLARTAIVAEVANSACTSQIALSGKTPRLIYEKGRALLAKSDVMAAKQQLELAVSSGYRAAQIDLASLLVDVSAGLVSVARRTRMARRRTDRGIRGRASVRIRRLKLARAG